MGERRTRNVLVVDDEEAILSAFRRSIQDHQVFTATSIPLARAIALHEDIDLVLVDLRLGGSASGLDFVRELKGHSPEIQVVVCSGYLSIEATVAAVRAGADLIVSKPITFSEVLRKLELANVSDDLPDIEEDTPTLAQVEWEHIQRVLTDCEGNISAAAKRLGIARSSLRRKLRKPTSES
jgi:two-component system, response regulator RegA